MAAVCFSLTVMLTIIVLLFVSKRMWKCLKYSYVKFDDILECQVAFVFDGL